MLRWKMEKMSSCSTLDSLNAGVNPKSWKRLAGDFKECLTCTLCSGYIRSAVTITLCMHSFCRECLTRHIRRSRACPKCLCLIHPVKPSTNIRSDVVLQRLVYKMLPGLFEIELERRKKQVSDVSKNNKGSSQGKSRTAIFTGYENISICLQHRPSSTIQSDQEEAQRVLCPRYLLCPSRVTVDILKRFIENKFNLSRKMEVNIFYMDHPLLDDYKLIDVAYIFGWDQVNPMMLSYSILQLNPSASVSEQTSAVTTQHSTRNSTTGTKPSQESSSPLSHSSQQSHSTDVPAPSSSPGGEATSTSLSSSNTTTESIGETEDDVKVAQCHSTSEGTARRRGRKRKKSKRSSNLPSPVTKRFCVRDDGPGIVMTFLSVKDCDGGSQPPQEKSPGAGPAMVAQNAQATSVSCVETAVAEVDKENVVRSPDPVVDSAFEVLRSVDQDAAYVNTCGSICADLGESHTRPIAAVIDHQNSVVFECTNDIISPDTVIERLTLSTDVVESGLGRVNGTDLEGNITGIKVVSSAKNDRTLETNDAKKLALSSEREQISSVSDILSMPALPNSDSINVVSSTIETKTINDSTKLCGPDIPHVAKTLAKDKTQFLEADSSMLPVTPCTTGIYGPPSCIQMVSGLCEAAASEKFLTGQKDTGVLCPQCGRQAGFVDGTSVTSTSNSIRCHSCLSFNTSITLFINHGQGRVNTEERIEFPRGQAPLEEPQERMAIPEVPILRINDPGGGVSDRGSDICADIVPKLECLDDDHVSKGPNCGLANNWDRACFQQAHPTPSTSSSFSAVSTITSRLCQPPVDPNALQTKATCQSGHQSIVPSNGSPSDNPQPSTADSSPAAGSAVGVEGDRCPGVALSSALLTGNKSGRKQKSLESIIRQLQPRQMSPAAAGAGSMKLPPRAPPSPSVNRKPVVQETQARPPPTDKEQSMTEERLGVRPNLEGEGLSLWSAENQPMLRRALAISGRNFQLPTARFPRPEERLHTAPPGNQTLYSSTAPPIKRLKNMFDGLDSSGYTSVLNCPVLSRGENRRVPQSIPTTTASTSTIRDTRAASGFNCLPAFPEAVFQDSHPWGNMNRRFPTVAAASANGFDAPLELTTKESRDRKRRETAKKLDGDVLRTSFPLFDNRR